MNAKRTSDQGHSRRVAHRRGSAYIIVLSTVVLVSVAGVAGVIAAREQRRAIETSVNVARARLIAQSGMELAQSQLQNTSSWRTSYADGKVIGSRAFAGGTMRVSATDPTDGDITNSTSDALTLTSYGVYGGATQMYQRRFKPSVSPIDSIGICAYAATNLVFSSVTLRAYGTVGCGSTASTSGGTNVYADVEAGVLVIGLTYRQSTTSLAKTRTVPATADVLAAYVSAGTEIKYSSLSSGDLKECVLGPGVNPYGTSNAQGIYWINCGGSRLQIKDCRIVGTLVVLNPKSDSQVTNSVLMEAATPGYPVLLVDGDMALTMDSKDLDESKANMNPPALPYRGASDSVADTDKYPSMLNGLIFVSGNLSIEKNTTIYGPVLCAKTITFKDSPVLYPVTPGPTPPGFSSAGAFVPVSGSWARVTN